MRYLHAILKIWTILGRLLSNIGIVLILVLFFKVAAKSSSILTMLPNNDAVIACYTEPGGILEGVQVINYDFGIHRQC